MPCLRSHSTIPFCASRQCSRWQKRRPGSRPCVDKDPFPSFVGRIDDLVTLVGLAPDLAGPDLGSGSSRRHGLAPSLPVAHRSRLLAARPRFSTRRLLTTIDGDSLYLHLPLSKPDRALQTVPTSLEHDLLNSRLACLERMLTVACPENEPVEVAEAVIKKQKLLPPPAPLDPPVRGLPVKLPS
jgi:hypothetical protein